VGKVFYKSEVGDLVCLVDHTWDYCGFGTVLKTFVNGMCEVYWYDLEEVALEYDTELSLCEEVDMKKCRSRIRLRNELLDRFYG
tara:strand:- start:196 stop:447 length:252 start_codon:yes stop_codon:yes gene_type:complete